MWRSMGRGGERVQVRWTLLLPVLLVLCEAVAAAAVEIWTRHQGATHDDLQSQPINTPHHACAY